jgi:hypothetical protein
MLQHQAGKTDRCARNGSGKSDISDGLRGATSISARFFAISTLANSAIVLHDARMEGGAEGENDCCGGDFHRGSLDVSLDCHC